MDKCQCRAINPAIAIAAAMASWPTAKGITPRPGFQGHQQKSQCCGNHQIFAMPDVIGAGFPNVEIKRGLARQFELQPPDNGPATVFEGRSHAREGWGQAIRLVSRLGRVLSEQRFFLLCPGTSDRENRDEKPLRKRQVPLAVPPRLLLTPARLLLNPQAGVLQSPGPRDPRRGNENEWSVAERRFQLAAFYTGCGLQMLFGVKRKRKKCNDGDKD